MNVYINKIKQIALPNKYTNWYISIIERALVRSIIIGYSEKHHILPKSFKLSGEKDKVNLVHLSAREHFIVHVLLTKMFNSIYKQKMIFALRNMKKSKKLPNRYFNSRLYLLLKINMTGKNNPFYGKCHSQVTKNKISATKKGKNNKNNNPFFGKHHTEETKKKISQTHLNSKRSEQTKKRMSENSAKPMLGKHHSEYTKNKLSQFFTGKRNIKCFIGVNQLDKNTGLIIKKWDSIIDAANSINKPSANIVANCKFRLKSAYGFIWRYN